MSIFTRKLIATVASLATVAALLGGYYYYTGHQTRLDSVAAVVADLPPSVPANSFVQLDLQHTPIQTKDYAVPGSYTLVIFHQKSCPDCRRLDQALVGFQERRRDVAVRKIDLGEKWSADSTLHDFGRKIWWTPFVVVYGPDTRLISADDAGKRDAWKLVTKWIAQEAVTAAH